MLVYGFQITPGCDGALGYCKDSGAAYNQARALRGEIKRVAAPGRLDPTAVYEIEIAAITAETIVAILNGYDAMSEILVLSKRLLGFVTED